MTLYRAVRTVIEEWDGDQPRQLGAVILREVGLNLTSLNDIKAIYARRDYPGR